ncbi:MAG: DUF2889 domain-containing protein [Pseudomonadales bacterium]|nr:DUF2889 domain-containing protein [Pseudomonadales bacterium]
MAFPPAAPRKHLHNRNIDCQGYLRDDGFWDIEARIVDVKTYTVDNRWRGPLEPGNPIHNMGVRLTIDHTFTVREVATTMDDQPHQICHEVLVNFQRLVGLSIGPGWGRKVKERQGGSAGCTHLVDLLGPMATVAFQTTASDAARDMARQVNPEIYPEVKTDPTKKPFVLNGCYTWSSGSSAVKEVYPLHYTGDKSVEEVAQDSKNDSADKTIFRG